jgi:hypothetical protein
VHLNLSKTDKAVLETPSVKGILLLFIRNGGVEKAIRCSLLSVMIKELARQPFSSTTIEFHNHSVLQPFSSATVQFHNYSVPEPFSSGPFSSTINQFHNLSVP